MSDDRVLVGVIGAAHGVRGELRLKSYTEDPLAIAGYGPLETEDGRRALTPSSARLLKDDMLVVRFQEVGDRASAETLTNLRVYVPRARLPAAADDEFYHADLVGLRAETAGGASLGLVVAVQNFGAGDLLEIAPETGPTLLVPFTKAFVPVVDLQHRRIAVSYEAIATDADEPDPR